MAIAVPSNEVIRLVESLGLRTKNTREVTLRMAVNEAVAVNTVEYVNGEQIGALAAELKERQYRLARWIPVEERLPEEGQVVLLYYGGDTDPIAVGKYLGLGGVTHWMPLPEPPSCATH